MAYPTHAQEKRLAELKREVAKPGFDRHAHTLSNWSELPAELQSPTLTAWASREEIHPLVIFPPQIQRGWHYVPKQALLFTATGLTHLLASIWPDEEPQVTILDGCGLMYLKATLLLLYGYLEIVAQGQDSPIRLGMEFNTVAWNCLSPPLRQLLRASKTISNLPGDEVAYSPHAQRAFEKLPFKFWNGVKIYGLLPGEEVEELLFQNATWKSWLYFFRRPVTADTLLMLTTNYVVLIQEDLNVRQGWVVSFIPRSCIFAIQSQPLGLWNELSVQLRRGNQLANCKLLLAKDAVDAWRIRWITHGGQWQDFPK